MAPRKDSRMSLFKNIIQRNRDRDRDEDTDTDRDRVRNQPERQTPTTEPPELSSDLTHYDAAGRPIFEMRRRVGNEWHAADCPCHECGVIPNSSGPSSLRSSSSIPSSSRPSSSRSNRDSELERLPSRAGSGGNREARSNSEDQRERDRLESRSPARSTSSLFSRVPQLLTGRVNRSGSTQDSSQQESQGTRSQHVRAVQPRTGIFSSYRINLNPTPTTYVPSGPEQGSLAELRALRNASAVRRTPATTGNSPFGLAVQPGSQQEANRTFGTTQPTATFTSDDRPRRATQSSSWQVPDSSPAANHTSDGITREQFFALANEDEPRPTFTGASMRRPAIAGPRPVWNSSAPRPAMAPPPPPRPAMNSSAPRPAINPHAPRPSVYPSAPMPSTTSVSSPTLERSTTHVPIDGWPVEFTNAGYIPTFARRTPAPRSTLFDGFTPTFALEAGAQPINGSSQDDRTSSTTPQDHGLPRESSGDNDSIEEALRANRALFTSNQHLRRLLPRPMHMDPIQSSSGEAPRTEEEIHAMSPLSGSTPRPPRVILRLPPPPDPPLPQPSRAVNRRIQGRADNLDSGSEEEDDSFVYPSQEILPETPRVDTIELPRIQPVPPNAITRRPGYRRLADRLMRRDRRGGNDGSQRERDVRAATDRTPRLGDNLDRAVLVDDTPANRDGDSRRRSLFTRSSSPRRLLPQTPSPPRQQRAPSRSMSASSPLPGQTPSPSRRQTDSEDDWLPRLRGGDGGEKEGQRHEGEEEDEEEDEYNFWLSVCLLLVNWSIFVVGMAVLAIRLKLEFALRWLDEFMEWLWEFSQ